MSRPVKWPPSIFVRDGHEFIRVTVGGRRQDFRLGPQGSDRAKQRYAQLIEQLRAGQVVGSRPDNATVTIIVDQWRATAPRRYRADSREPKEFRYAVAPLVELYGATAAREFGPRALKAVRQKMIDDGLSRKVINRRVVRIKTLFKWATEEELIPGDVYQSLRAVRALPPGSPGVHETAGVPSVSWDEVKAVYRHCSRGPGAMLLIQWFTGMRSQEVRLLRAVDIDQASDVWSYVPSQHKNQWRGQDRRVAFGPLAQRVLRRWLRLAPTPTSYLFDPRLETRGRAAKDHYTDSAYGLAVSRAAERAGITMRAYSTRHGQKDRVSRMFGAEAARASLGQKTIDSTQLYGRIDYELAAKVARECG